MKFDLDMNHIKAMVKGVRIQYLYIKVYFIPYISGVFFLLCSDMTVGRQRASGVQHVSNPKKDKFYINITITDN